MSEYKLSLPAAILININIMLGSGIFINMLQLSQKAGLLSPFVYIIVGIFMLPIVFAMAKMLKIYPGGTFYDFGKNEINKFFGFFGSWGYFSGKLASATIMIHFAVLLLQQVFPLLNNVNIFIIDLIILSLFSILNLFGLKSGSKIQYLFIFFKFLPIIFVIATGIILFRTENLVAQNLNWAGILPSIPLVIYAFGGFEAACSLSRHIQNPEKNSARAVLISFLIVVCVLSMYQFFSYLLFNFEALKMGKYFEAFIYLLKTIFPAAEIIRNKIQMLLQVGIALSALGGSYGIMFSNIWNFYILIENKHTFIPALLGKLNKYKIPVFCILIEFLICCFYLFITGGNQIILQQTGAFGTIIAYSISVVALLFYAFKKEKILKLLAILATLSCLILLGILINGFIVDGIYSLIIFGTILLAGSLMYFIVKNFSYNDNKKLKNI